MLQRLWRSFRQLVARVVGALLRTARGWTDRYAGRVVQLRWVLALAWVGTTIAAVALLPAVSSTGSSNPTAVLPANSPALAAQLRSLTEFAIPNVSTTIVVVRDPAGLDPLEQADIVLWAAQYDQQLSKDSAPYQDNQVLGALPLLNGLPQLSLDGVPVVPAGPATTSVTYLYFSPSTGASAQTQLAQQYADHFVGFRGVRSYVTGVDPATTATGHYLHTSLPRMTLATLLLVALIVGITFRSMVAPLVTLGAAGLAYLVDLRVLGAFGHATGLSLPSELDPIIVALLLGITTDYTVLFLADLRDRLAAGEARVTAVPHAISENVSIVLMAGLTVATGTAALQVSSSALFRSFGPGLAITVVIGLAVASTLIPALMALLGPAMFWPSSPRPLAQRPRRPRGPRTVWWVRLVTNRRSAALALVGCLALLVAASLPVMNLRLGVSFVKALPSSAPARVGAQAAAAGYAAGITAPTEVLIEAPGVDANRTALATLQQEVSGQPGVAGVLGALDDPLLDAHGLLFSTSGAAARLFVVFDSDPLGASAISDLRSLMSAMPELAQRVGLGQAQLQYAGQTAIAGEAAQLTTYNLRLILVAGFGVEFLLLAVYLSALVAPLVLLVASALVVGASLGLAVLVFGSGEGLTFYAPFSAAVLLVALGSDYNVFGVGGIWEETRHRPLVPAMRTALPRTTRAITTAGLTLAGSFALVAIIPLGPFREIAFLMGVGLLIDTFVVRSVLTPSVITLLGPVAGWPGGRLRRRTDDAAVDVRPALTGRNTCVTAEPSDRATHRDVGTGSGSAPRRHRGRHRMLRIGVTVLVVAALVWGSDEAIRIATQDAVASTVRRAEGLVTKPTVAVHGSFFLPQAIRGRYSDIDISAQGIEDGGLRVAQLTAHLHGLHVALGPLITGNVPGIPIDSSQERVTITYADLNRYLTGRGYPVTVAAGEKGALKLTGHVTVLGKTISLSADTKFEPIAAGVDVTPVQLDTGTSVLNALSQLTLGSRVSFVIPTAQLPFGQQVTGVTAGPAGITITAAGTDIVVSTKS